MTGELTATDYNYSTSETRYLMIPAAAFVPEKDLPLGAPGSLIYKAGAGAGNYAHAPVQLPNGAVMTNARLYFYDADETQSNVETTIKRVLAATGQQVLVTTSTSPITNPGGYSYTDNAISATYATINNVNYTYYAELNLEYTSLTAGFVGLRIEYTVTKP